MIKTASAANYIFWLEELQPTIRETPENHNVGRKDFLSLALEKLQFSYPLRPQARILRGIDLHINKEQFVAFVGASGCGKSAMIGILERFYDPVTGHVKVDGKGLDEMNPWLFRNNTSLVQHEPTLYPGTIGENISMGKASEGSGPVSEAEIESAGRAANAWDFISSLPDRMSTPSGHNGTQLSGRQRQRIAGTAPEPASFVAG